MKVDELCLRKQSLKMFCPRSVVRCFLADPAFIRFQRQRLQHPQEDAA